MPQSPSEEILQWKADLQDLRLDLALHQKFPHISRSRFQNLIDEGRILVNGKKEKSNYKINKGDLVVVSLPPPRPLALEAEDIPLQIYFEDDDLAVVEKPAGMVVHPAAGHDSGTLVNALLHHFPNLSHGGGIGGVARPGIVHRIDKNTSGILLITKTDFAHNHLSDQFKKHSISRKYLAVCYGTLPPMGEYNGSIGRHPTDRKRMSVQPDGRKALTKFKTLFTKFGLSFVEAELFTGRTHQIRVHFSSDGHALVGDKKYLEASKPSRDHRAKAIKLLDTQKSELLNLVVNWEEEARQFLHAAHLGFVHPRSSEKMSFNSELPNELNKFVLALQS